MPAERSNVPVGDVLPGPTLSRARLVETRHHSRAAELDSGLDVRNSHHRKGDDMHTMRRLALGLLILAAGCADDSATASATFNGTNGQTVTGTAKFTDDGKVSLTVTLTAAPDGVHGIHIHNVPSCGNEGMDAGPHWDDDNTDATNHHLPPGGGHLGDLGNITVASGKGSITFSNPAWTLGDGKPTDVVPHAMIFHQMMDDGTMPSAGARWGCALIAKE
jgi:Cu-Zn family superoxide dismutase